MIVPAGQTCVFAGAQIQGSVSVHPGARLEDAPLTINLVRGNLTSQQAAAVELRSTRVVGNVELKQTASTIVLGPGFSAGANLKLEQGARVLIDSATVTGDVDVIKIMAGVEAVEVRDAIIGGKLTIADSLAGEIAVVDNAVEGDISVQNNIADLAGLAVDANQAMGNLEVKNNNVPTELATASVSLNDVDRNLVIDNNLIDTREPFDMAANQVADNMNVIKNRGSTTKVVIANVVADTLACFDNDDNLGTFVGGPNLASRAEGQCF